MRNIEIQKIFISPDHGYVGQEPDKAKSQTMDSVSSVECVAGAGLRGDRYFAHKENYKGQATFFSSEVFDAVLNHTGADSCPPWAMRRNIMVSAIMAAARPA